MSRCKNDTFAFAFVNFSSDSDSFYATAACEPFEYDGNQFKIISKIAFSFCTEFYSLCNYSNGVKVALCLWLFMFLSLFCERKNIFVNALPVFKRDTLVHRCV